MSESYPGCWKGILPTPAPSKIPKITHRGDSVNRVRALRKQIGNTVPGNKAKGQSRGRWAGSYARGKTILKVTVPKDCPLKEGLDIFYFASESTQTIPNCGRLSDTEFSYIQKSK